MSNLHKLFLEMRKLSEDERDILQELIREVNNVEHTCNNLGIKFTDEILISWINNMAHWRSVKPINTIQPSNSNNPPDSTIKKMEQIIRGDNLDLIEEAAKEKGLI